MVGYLLYLYRSECAKSDVEHNGCDLDTLLFYLFEKLGSKVETCSRCGSTPSFARIHSLISILVLKRLCYVRRHPQASPRGLKQRCEVKFYEYKYKQLAARMRKSV